ncbi:MAG: HD domain-containing protein [Gemmatimonadota bacterium]
MNHYPVDRIDPEEGGDAFGALERQLRAAKVGILSPDVGQREALSAALHEAGFTNTFAAALPDVGWPGQEFLACSVLIVDLDAPGARRLGAISAGSSRAPALIGIEPIHAAGAVDPQQFSSVLRSPVDPRLLLFAVRCQLLLHHARATAAGSASSAPMPTPSDTPVEIELLHRMARAAESRVDPTGIHVERVGALSALLAIELGLGEDRARLLRHAAPLHDFGKVSIPDDVLLDPEPLSSERFGLMKLHTRFGAEILRGLGHPVTDMAADIAWCHHERWDGEGYPRGLSGEEIPIEARIVAVADLFDAVAHARGTPEDLEEGLALVRGERGQAFDPDVVDALFRLWMSGGAASLYEGDDAHH